MPRMRGGLRQLPRGASIGSLRTPLCWAPAAWFARTRSREWTPTPWRGLRRAGGMWRQRPRSLPSAPLWWWRLRPAMLLLSQTGRVLLRSRLRLVGGVLLQALVHQALPLRASRGSIRLKIPCLRRGGPARRLSLPAVPPLLPSEHQLRRWTLRHAPQALPLMRRVLRLPPRCGLPTLPPPLHRPFLSSLSGGVLISAWLRACMISCWMQCLLDDERLFARGAGARVA